MAVKRLKTYRKKVYRIQDHEGRGPFRPGFSKYWIEPRSDHDNLQPWFTEFGMVSAKDGLTMGCGCASIEKLQRWITKSEYQTLLKHGYKAVVMGVDGILGESESQIMFERKMPLSRGATIINLYKPEAFDMAGFMRK